jgi:hypothetical protein
MTVSGPTELETQQSSPPADTPTAVDAPGGTAEIPAWLRDDAISQELAEAPLTTMSFEDVERRRMQSLMFLGGAVVVCAALGWLIGPSLLVGTFENLTGTTVEDLSDLRGMGTMGGLIVGMFVGAAGGWAIWSSK